MQHAFTLRGLYPAPEVPFDAQLKIAEAEFSRHIARLGSIPGVGGVAVNGYQGEIGSLTSLERQRVTTLAREQLPAGQAVISGIHAVSIPDMVTELRRAKEAGADAALVVPNFDFLPYRYAGRSWEGPVALFSSLADSVDLPLVIFQLMHTSGASYTTETLVRLAEIPNVVAIKQAVYDAERYVEQVEALAGRLSVVIGCDSPTLLTQLFMGGADGALIGISNVGPEYWAQFITLCLQQDWAPARDLFMQRLLPIMRFVWGFDHSRRIYTAGLMKEALAQLGVYSSGRVRAPGLAANAAERAQIRHGLQQAGLLAPG